MSFFVRRTNVRGLPVHTLMESRMVMTADGGAALEEIPRFIGAGLTELDAAISLAQEMQGAMVQAGNNVIDASRDERATAGQREIDALPRLKSKKVGEPGTGNGNGEDEAN